MKKKLVLIGVGTDGTVQGGEKLQLIDHGLSFPDKGDTDSGNRDFLKRVNSEYGFRKSEINPELKQSFVDAKPEILNSLKALGLPSGSIKGVAGRIDELGKANKWGRDYG